MKKLIILFIVLFAFNVFAINYIKTGEGAISWDAVTTLEDGSPIPENHEIKYSVFSKDLSDVERKQGVTNGLSLAFAIYIPEGGPYSEYNVILVGVQACLYPTNQGDDNFVSLSCAEVAWSDNELDTPDPFVYTTHSNPSKVTNLQDMVEATQ